MLALAVVVDVSQVTVEALQSPAAFAAAAADEGTLSGVRAPVQPQLPPVSKPLPALCAAVGPPEVSFRVLLQRSAQDEGSGAQRAAVGSLARVEAPVSPQGSPVLEDLITKAANVELADGSLQYLRPLDSHRAGS